jgi:hypothetical protein
MMLMEKGSDTSCRRGVWKTFASVRSKNSLLHAATYLPYGYLESQMLDQVFTNAG